MSIKKQYVKTKGYWKVTFRLTKQDVGSAQKAALAGDFNDWQIEPMKPLKGGDFTTTVNLTPGRDYHYRYVLDDSHWLTDENADRIEFCHFAQANNAVVRV